VGGGWVLLDYNVSSGPFLSFEIEIGDGPEIEDGPGPELDNNEAKGQIQVLCPIGLYSISHILTTKF